MKHIKHWLATMAVLLCSVTASAYDFEVGGIYYNITSDTDLTVEITYEKYDDYFYISPYSGNVVISESVTYNGETYQVTSIGRDAFWNCSGLTSITIPESVTSIGDEAFFGCDGLTTITLPESVTSIGDFAFSYCSLTSITLPESVTSIGERAFNGCRSLTSITLPENSQLTSIEYATFEYCSILTTITIPENSQLTSIGDAAFRSCSSLASITIPEGVTSIWNEAFYDCWSLTTINIPEGVTSIGNRAFEYCSLTTVHISDIAAWCKIDFFEAGSNPLRNGGNLYLNGVAVTGVTIPEEVTEVKKYAFYNCKSITSVIIPTGITKIDENAFYGCSNLSTVTLPSSLYMIRASAFERCSSLKSITIPATVEFVYQKAFASCDKLESVKVLAVKPPFANENTFSNYNIELCVPEEAMSAYQETNPWSKFASIKNLEGEEVETKVCATPVVNYVDGKVMLTCETEEAKVITTIAKGDDETREEMEFDLIPTYTITAYATKEGYHDSDIATVTLCWITCTEDHKTGDEDGIITIPSQPVLISTQGGTITLTGLAEGTDVAVYTTAGTQLGTATAVSGTATITTSLTTGNTAIVKIGNNSIKVVVK